MQSLLIFDTLSSCLPPANIGWNALNVFCLLHTGQIIRTAYLELILYKPKISCLLTQFAKVSGNVWVAVPRLHL